MKKLLYMIMIFIALTIFSLLRSTDLEVQAVNSIDYIRNIPKETVVLVSNNIFNGEISSYQEKNNQDFSNSTPLTLSYLSTDNLKNQNSTFLKGYFIHNLSTNKLEVHQIRAP